MQPDKILEIARRYTYPDVREDQTFEFCEEELIAFARAVLEEERERIRARVMQAAVKSWHGYDLTIGVPYVRLKAFTDALLEEE